MEHGDNFLGWFAVRHRAGHGGPFSEERWSQFLDDSGGRWQPVGSGAADLLAYTPASSAVWELLAYRRASVVASAPARTDNLGDEERPPAPPGVALTAPGSGDTLAGTWESPFRGAAMLCRSLIGAVTSRRVLEAQVNEFVALLQLHTAWMPVEIRRTFERKEVKQVFRATPAGMVCLSTYFGLAARKLRACPQCGNPFVRTGRSWTRVCPTCRPGTALPSLSTPRELASEESGKRFRKLRARLNRRAERTLKGKARADAAMTLAQRTLDLRRANQGLLLVEKGKKTYDAWDAEWDKGTRLTGGRPKAGNRNRRGR